QEEASVLEQEGAAAGGVPRAVDRPGTTGNIDGLSVGERGHLANGDQPAGSPPEQREGRPVERRAKQIRGRPAVVSSRLAPLRSLRVLPVDPYGSPGRGPGAFGEPDVVRVRVGEQHSVQVLHRSAPATEGRG